MPQGISGTPQPGLTPLLAAGLIVTWLTPGTDPATLDRFYRRVRPPGLWWRRFRRSERRGI